MERTSDRGSSRPPTPHRVEVTLERADREGQPVIERATTARPASSRATGTRNGEHDT